MLPRSIKWVDPGGTAIPANVKMFRGSHSVRENLNNAIQKSCTPVQCHLVLNCGINNTLTLFSKKCIQYYYKYHIIMRKRQY